MNNDLVPADEVERVAAVRCLGLVDTPPEPGFDRLVRLATTLLDVPMAYIGFVDADRSWFKARVGLEMSEATREAAFCSHTILQAPGEVLVVPDTWLDERFEDHPLVTAAPRVRFLAACALRAPGGEAVGTLTVIDREPRSLSGRERLALADLAAVAEELIAGRVEDRSATTDRSDQVDPHPEPALVDWTAASTAPTIESSAAVAFDAGLPQFSVTSERVAELESQLEATSLLLEYTADMVVVLDASAKITFASPSLERVLGHTAEFRHPEGAMGMFHADDRATARRRLTAAMAGEPGDAPFNMRVTTAGGSIRNVECVVHSLFATRSVGGVVLTMRDVSDRHLLSQMLAFQSTHDRLTELPNRMLFQEHLSPALARAVRERRPIAVCYLDLVDFQELNDRLGYAAGDELLVDVAKRIRASIRNGDSAARLGADEFAVLLDPVADVADAELVAQRIVDAISGPHSLQTGVASCRAHVGVAVSEADDDATSVIARAARALHAAKASPAS